MSDDIKLPEPAFRLTWDDSRAGYYVSKPNVGDTDVFTADQLRAAVLADREERASADDNVFRTLTLELVGLIEESSGVYGLHLNGDVSPWDELLPQGRFERLTSLHDAIEALQTPPADRAESAHGIVEKESGNG